MSRLTCITGYDYDSPLHALGTSSLDRLNVPTGDRGQQLRAGQLSAELSGQLAELAAALANYHTYCEQRLHALSSHGLSAVRAKVGPWRGPGCSLLCGNAVGG